MTSDFKNEFKRLRDDLALTSEERIQMRSTLMALSEAQETSIALVPVPSPFSYLTRGAFAFLALIVVSVGGTTFAAERALPGDTLYAVKTEFNERIERAVTFGAIAKADVDVRHAEERIVEVELLAAKGKEDTREIQDIALAIDTHVERAGDTVRTLLNEGEIAAAEAVAARIDSTLAAHADILEAQAENEEGEDRRKLRALSVALSVTASERVPEEEKTTPRTEGYYQEIATLRGETVERSIEALARNLKENGVPEESVVELTTEHEMLLAEHARLQLLLSEGKYKEAEEEYQELGRRAYRALALIVSAKRIADETDKEVVVDLGGKEDIATSTTMKETPSEAETALLMLMSQNTEADRSLSQNEEAPELTFLLRDRSR